MTREAELAEKGWKKRTILDEPRLSEVVKMYEEIDLEVHLEPFSPDDEDDCTECMKATPEKYKIIFTRKIS
jgi:hypothetical protein